MRHLAKYPSLLVLVLFSILALLPTAGVRAAVLTKIFWGDATLGQIAQRDIGGTTPSTLLSSAANVKGMAVDPFAGKLYWVNGSGGKIERANVNGSSRQNVVTGLVDPHDLVLDLANNRLFWTDPGRGLVQRCSLASLPCIPATVASSPKPFGLALDVTANQLYWGDDTVANPRIRKCNADSCTTPADVITGLGSVGDVALDPVNNKLYWVDWWNGIIRRANPDGSGAATIYTLAPPATLGFLALDVEDGSHLYWTESSEFFGRIRRANLDGTAPADLVTGLGNPFGLALDFPQPEMMVQGNGTEIINGDLSPAAGDHTDFGGADRVIGSVGRTFTVRNPGRGPLNLTGSPNRVIIGGTHPADFSVTLQPGSPVAVAGSTTFDITFDPSALGTRTATISIANDDIDENPYTFGIAGEGTCPAAVTVTSTADSGADSLREAIDRVCDGGTITFGGDTLIGLNSPLGIAKSMTIDGGSSAVTLSGGGTTRIFDVTAGSVTFAHLTIANGKAGDGGGISNTAAVTVQNSTLTGNTATVGGGAIVNTGTLIVQNSTFTGNSAGYGGGINNGSTAGTGTATVQNSTFFNNSASGHGGGISNGATLTVQNSTLSGNSAGTGGGINNAGTLHLYNTVIANSSSGGDCRGPVTTDNRNLIRATGVNACDLISGQSSLIGLDPRLSPLGDYGGNTQTFALLPGSPAIHAGNNGTCLGADQRGFTRPLPADGGICDIGAFESHGFTLAVTGGSGQSQFVNQAFATPLGVQVTSAAGEPVGPGGRVTFTGPGSGAGLNPGIQTTSTDAGGNASLSVTANAAAGVYQVTAHTIGGAGAISFDLTNVAGNILINELDADQGAADTAEFIELYDGGASSTSLAGLVLVLYNGSGDQSYRAIDLDAYSTGPGGYLALCANGAALPGCGPDSLEDGPAAVALYRGNAADFPNGTPVTTANLVDAVVYDTDDADDTGLLALLNAGQPQVNENNNGRSATESNGRCPNGTGGARNTASVTPQPPTPGSANSCIPVVEFTQANYGVGEAAGTTAVVTLSRAGYLVSGSTVQVSVTGGTAGGADFTNDFPRTITFDPDQVSATVSVVIADDSMYELPETITFQVTPVTNAVAGSQTSTTLAITDNDLQPSVTLALSGSPLAEAGGIATVTASLSNPSYQEITVNLALTGTAAAGDYTASGTIITIPAGDLSGDITLTGQDDTLDEPAETIIVAITGVTGATEDGTQQVTATLTDDDLPPTVAFTQASQSGPEDGPNLLATLQLSTASGYDVSVPFTLSGSATQGTDYTLTASPVTIPAGDTSIQVSLNPSTDNTYEPGETVILTLGAPTNATLGAVTAHTATITNDDPLPSVSLALSGSPLAEAGGIATVTANLSNPSYQAITIYLDLTGTAAAGDYTASGTAITILSGNLSGDITLTGQNDAVDELDETIVVNISSVTGATEDGAQQITATIADDDERGVRIAPTSGLVTGEDGRQDTFTVVLDSEPTAAVTITLVSDTPAEGTVAPTQLVFTPQNWSLPRTITVTGVNDNPPVADGPVVYNIQALAANGGDYTGLNPTDVEVTNEDNDVPSIAVNPTSLTVTEPAGSATFTLSLNTQPRSGASVTVDLSTSNGQCSLSAASVTITNANWQTGLSVQVTAVNDDIDDGSLTCTVVTANPVSADADYNGAAANPADVTVTVEDEDTAGIVVTPDRLTVREPAGTAVFTISLKSEPIAPVQIDLSSSPADECQVPASITLNAGNWRTGLPVTVTALDDDDVDGSLPCTINGAISTSDSSYSPLLVDPVTVTVQDDDRVFVYLPLLVNTLSEIADLVIVPGSLQARGGSITLEIRNAGNTPIEDAFWVDVYFNPSQVPALNKPWDTIAPYGAVWGVTQALAPGESLVLTSGGAYYVPAASSPTFPAGAQVYALVDSVNYVTGYGNVLESNESNNLAGPVTSVQGQAATTGSQGRQPALDRLPER